jgi:hypothetical protein
VRFYNHEKQDSLRRILSALLGTDRIAVGLLGNMAGYSCALYFDIPANHCFPDLFPIDAVQKTVKGVLSKTSPYINLEARIAELEEELKERKSLEISKDKLSEL